MKKITLTFLGILFFGFFWANAVKAVCPVCVVVVGAGLGLSEWLGIDDAISSIWIGALLIATVLWTLTEMKKKNWSFAYDKVVIFLAYYLLVFVPLFYSGIIGHPLNKIFGIDKIIFGSAVGTIMFLLSHWLYQYLKQKNNGKPFFSYQKVVMPVAILLLTSVAMYLLLIWRII